MREEALAQQEEQAIGQPEVVLPVENQLYLIPGRDLLIYLKKDYCYKLDCLTAG